MSIKTRCLNNNSLIPSIEESERFVRFLNVKFGLTLPDNFIITIGKAKKTCSGYFMPSKHSEHFEREEKPLHAIHLNSLNLKHANPYEVLAHETAHFFNEKNGVKDCTINQYHNKHFKDVAERLLLKVDKGIRGFAYTSITPQFEEMLKLFKPNKNVFDIYQNSEDKQKKGSRLKLYECSCGVKVRCAVELNAICLNCNELFERVGE